MGQACTVAATGEMMTAELEYITYTVTFATNPPSAKDRVEWKVTADAGATMLKSGDQVNAGTQLSIEVVGKDGYGVTKLVIKGEDIPLSLSEPVEKILTSDITLVATVKQSNCSITYTEPSHGSLTVVGANVGIASGVSLKSNTKLTLIATPHSGYRLSKFVAVVDGEENQLAADKIGSTAPVTVSYMLVEDVKFVVEFEEVPVIKYTVTYTAAPANGTVAVKNGTADVITGSKVDKDTNLTVILTPVEGYKVKSAVAKVVGKEDKTLDLTANTTDKTFSATYKLEANVTFVVEFEAIPLTLYTISYATPANGVLEVKNGTDKVATGAKLAANTELTLIATPAEGYMLATLMATVDGKETKIAEEKKGSFTLTYPLSADVTFTATFKKEKPGAVIDAQLASVRVYPNPFTTELRIVAQDVQTELRYALFDALGNCLLTGHCDQAASLDTEALMRGIYFLRLTTPAGATQVVKLVKK